MTDTKKKRVLATLVVVAALLLVPAVAYTSSIKVWTSSERLTSTDINANFAHLHNTMVGGHGARLVDSDVSASAALTHSKMATPALLPKAWAIADSGPCDGAAASDTVTCTKGDSSKVTSIKSSGTAGTYRVTLAYTPTDTHFAILVTSHTSTVYCNAFTHAITAPHFIVECRTDASVLTNAYFSVAVLDT